MTDRQKKNWKSYCSEPLELVENYQQAKADGFEGWCIHHRREIKLDGTRVSAQELIDKGLYCGRPASELIFMRFGEHATLHRTGNHHSAETLQKMSEAQKGKHHSTEARKKMSESHKGKHQTQEHCQKISEAMKGENNPFFGKHHTEESRKKMSMSLKGFHKGTRWWNNGISNARSRECPGPEWKRGRI